MEKSSVICKMLAIYLCVSANLVFAESIDATDPQHYRNTFGPNRYTGGGDSLFVGLNVYPSPKNAPGLGDATIVTAEQNGTELTLNQPTSVFNPDFYFATVGYDSNLTGSWNLTVQNSDSSITNSPFNIASPVVGAQSVIDPVKSMSIAGSLDSGFKLAWEAPAESDATQVDISIIDGNNWGTIIHSAFLNAGVSEYEIPDVLVSGEVLEEGQTYMVSITSAHP